MKMPDREIRIVWNRYKILMDKFPELNGKELVKKYKEVYENIGIKNW